MNPPVAKSYIATASQTNEKSVVQLLGTGMSKNRRSRRKIHACWEDADRLSNGLYSRYVQEIARAYPTLTSMELKTCALIKALKCSWEISDLLGVSEHTIENHRVHIRRKFGLTKGSNLFSRLFSL
jgi:DNA-binding CsgD family transcriptional regulator